MDANELRTLQAPLKKQCIGSKPATALTPVYLSTERGPHPKVGQDTDLVHELCLEGFRSAPIGTTSCNDSPWKDRRSFIVS